MSPFGSTALVHSFTWLIPCGCCGSENQHLSERRLLMVGEDEHDNGTQTGGNAEQAGRGMDDAEALHHWRSLKHLHRCQKRERPEWGGRGCFLAAT